MRPALVRVYRYLGLATALFPLVAGLMGSVPASNEELDGVFAPHFYRVHCDYIHYNPVKHGHATSPLDWPYPTFHRAVRLGEYPANWGAKRIVFPDHIGAE